MRVAVAAYLVAAENKETLIRMLARLRRVRIAGGSEWIALVAVAEIDTPKRGCWPRFLLDRVWRGSLRARRWRRRPSCTRLPELPASKRQILLDVR